MLSTFALKINPHQVNSFSSVLWADWVRIRVPAPNLPARRARTAPGRCGFIFSDCPVVLSTSALEINPHQSNSLSSVLWADWIRWRQWALICVRTALFVARRRYRCVCRSGSNAKTGYDNGFRCRLDYSEVGCRLSAAPSRTQSVRGQGLRI